MQSTNCYALANSNSGCQTVDPSQASYGTQFNVLKGGIFAMMWANDGIRVCAFVIFLTFPFHLCLSYEHNSVGFFHRAAIPSDILANAPQPNNWGTPTAYLGGALCDTNKYFFDHSIIFGKVATFYAPERDGADRCGIDITFCGDWAGTSYISSGCPGTCSERIIDPANFAVRLQSVFFLLLLMSRVFLQNASWTINSLQVYQSPQIRNGDPFSGQASYWAIWKGLIMTATVFTFVHLLV